MTARGVVESLGGRWYSDYGVCACPAHHDEHPSLSVRDGEGGILLVRCHSGCAAEAVLRELRRRGLLDGRRPFGSLRAFRDSHPTDEHRTEAALRLWDGARPAEGTPVETYLRRRGIRIAPPPDLRFHPRCPHGPSGTNRHAMLAAVRDLQGRLTGIHRTFIAFNGAKSQITPNKMALGVCVGNAVHLAPASEELMVGEGIESVLAAMQSVGKPGWAALGTSGLKALELPPLPLGARVLILADNDSNGAGPSAAYRAARRWLAEGRRVRIALPPNPGEDFNDALRAPPEGDGYDRAPRPR